jgi:hypothetical protein
MSELNRREFLGTTAAVGGMMLATGLEARAATAAEGGAWTGLPPAKIHKVFAGRTGNFYMSRPAEEVAKLDAYFSEMEKKVPGVKFVGGDIMPPAAVGEVTAKLKDADALLIVHLSGHGGDAPVLGKLIDAGLPTAIFTPPYSGHGWLDFPQWHKQAKPVLLLPSSDWTMLDGVAGLLRAAAWIRQTRILAVGHHGTAAACKPELVKKKLGADLVAISHQTVLDAMHAIDIKVAEAEAQQYWIGPCREIVEPSRAEIIASARMYLGIRELMKREKAQAICSAACMGSPRGCFSFSKLNDQGLVGGCEGDIDSTLTLLLFDYACHIPGMISDPVPDLAKNALLHFHCTSATKMDGPCGKRLPFRIRDQTDTRGGAALEVQHRVGQPVTCAKLVNLDTMLMVSGKILETSTSPMACRTQFAQSVPDARRLFLGWGAGVVQGDTMTRLHRVVFYGDHMKSMQDLGELLGFKVVEDGGNA